MSTESPTNNNEEIQTALELIENDEFLKNDDRARNTVADGGVTPDGRLIDIGDFLAARRAVLEREQAEEKVTAARKKNPEAFDYASVGVIHSERPDLERE